MFIEHGGKIVNTNAVTNIVIEARKIIFNLDYSVSLQDEQDKHIPDYVYMYFDTSEEMEDVKQKIKVLNWITSDYGTTYNGNYKSNNRIVNPNAISFVKFEDRKNRIIFNLRNSISFSRNILSKTSDFVYYDHENQDDYYKESDRISDLLGGK